jgi:hypothetical protein
MATDCPAHSGGELSKAAEVEGGEIQEICGELSTGSDQAAGQDANPRCKLFPNKEIRPVAGDPAAGTIAKSPRESANFLSIQYHLNAYNMVAVEDLTPSGQLLNHSSKSFLRK